MKVPIALVASTRSIHAMVLAAGLATSISSLEAATRITLTPVRDNTLFEDADGDTSNGAGPVLFAGKNGQDRVRRGLLAFDVASSLPSGAKIDSVVLTLRVSRAPNGIPRQVTPTGVKERPR